MTTIELLSNLQKRAYAGEALTVSELRDATSQAVRFLVFSIASNEADQLNAFSVALTQMTDGYFGRLDKGEDTPREWARSLAVVGQIAVALYESMAPTAEVRKILGRSQRARKIAQILLEEGRMQAKELRERAQIPHQPTLARIIHALANARVVTVQQGPGNTAWYRLTPEGSRLLRSAVLSPDAIAVQSGFEIPTPKAATPATQEIVQLAREIIEKATGQQNLGAQSKAQKKAAVAEQREDSHAAAR
jgi:DNA-binding PadR family transcriptional regulator